MPAEAAMRSFDRRRLGVYVVTSGTMGNGRGHREIARAAIDGGATAVQLRAPELPDDDLLAVAAELATWCRAAGVLFIVNDRTEVAVEAGADGAHLGQGDDPGGARRLLGVRRVLGVSVDNATQAREAREVDPDYLGVTVWSTSTKPDATPHGLEGLAGIARASGLPVVGIGGIDADNARDVLRAGAAGVAVVSAVAAAADPVAATRRLREAVNGFRGEGGGS
jgi:thiamine-phosphate pyrophosphorylase